MSFGEVSNVQRAEAERHGLSIYSWDQFLKLVRESHIRFYNSTFHINNIQDSEMFVFYVTCRVRVNIMSYQRRKEATFAL